MKNAIDLFIDEIKNSDNLKNIFLRNIKSKKHKIISLNVSNIIFDFKHKTIEIQDDIGITDKRKHKISFTKFIQIIESIN
jgi:hypothetical protein